MEFDLLVTAVLRSYSHEPHSPVWDILILIFLVGSLGWGAYRHFADKGRDSAIRAWAQQRGYEYKDRYAVVLNDLRLFRKDFSPSYHNVVHGQIGGRVFDMFDLEQHYFAPVARHSFSIWTTAVAFCDFGVNLGEFAIHPAGFARKLQDWLGEAEIVLEGSDPEFSRRYTLRSEVPDVARAIVTPIIASVIANTEGELCIEGRRNFLIVYAPYSGDRLFGDATIPAKQWENFLDCAQRIGGAILRSGAKIEVVREG